MARRFEKGAYLYTIQDGGGANLFASKAFVAPDGASESVWRLSEPSGEAAIKTILRKIEAEILAGHEAREVRLAELFLSVRGGEIDCEAFEERLSELYSK